MGTVGLDESFDGCAVKDVGTAEQAMSDVTQSFRLCEWCLLCFAAVLSCSTLLDPCGKIHLSMQITLATCRCMQLSTLKLHQEDLLSANDHEVLTLDCRQLLFVIFFVCDHGRLVPGTLWLR